LTKGSNDKGVRLKDFNSDIRNEPQERQKGRGNRGVGIGKMVKNYGFIYFFLDK